MKQQNRFLGIELAKGVKGRNMLAYLFVTLVTSGVTGARLNTRD